MMVLSPINEEQYDLAAGNIIYGKLFPKLLEDFVARADAKLMMKSSNLPVTTNVSTLVNTVVSVVIPAGTGTGIGKGTGSGTGNTNPIYIADTPSPEAQLLKQRRLAEKKLGTAQTEGQISGIKAIAGE